MREIEQPIVFVGVGRSGTTVIYDAFAARRDLARFWRKTWRLRAPAWANGLRDVELRRWHEHGGSALVLAAIEWCAVLARAREEAEQVAPDRYAEVRYEDFAADPHRALDELADFCCLPPSREPHDFIDARLGLEDMNIRWRDALGSGRTRATE
jgi:hypothetical protein